MNFLELPRVSRPFDDEHAQADRAVNIALFSTIPDSTRRAEDFAELDSARKSKPYLRDEHNKELFLRLINDGFPKISPSAELNKVVVVGAGISGICASYELLKAGYDVTLLERTQRPGGRIFTVREPFSDGLWGEAGAMRIPAAHFLDWAYIERFSIPVNKFNNKCENKVLYYEEPEIPQTRTLTSDAEGQMRALESYWRRTLRINEDSIPISEKFDRAMLELVGEIQEVGYTEVVERYDNMSFRDLLCNRFGWTQNEVLLYSMTSTEESFMSVGAVECFEEYLAQVWKDSAEYPDPLNPDRMIHGLHEITGGMDNFTNGFLKEPIERATGSVTTVADHIHYGATVVKLNTQPDESGMVSVEYSVGGGAVTRQEKAHFVILAMPFTALRAVDVNPPFSVLKQEAIREVSYAPSGKIFLQYSKRWWRDETFAEESFPFLATPAALERTFAPSTGGGGAATTLPVRQIYFPPDEHSTHNGNTTERGVIIASYTWEQDTVVWGSKPPQQIVREAAEQVEKVYPGSLQYLELGTSVMWHNVPWTEGGAFAYFKPGQWRRLYHPMVKEDGDQRDPRFLFAGEHCSVTHAWIQGALDAALTACIKLHNLRARILQA